MWVTKQTLPSPEARRMQTSRQESSGAATSRKGGTRIATPNANSTVIRSLKTSSFTRIHGFRDITMPRRSAAVTGTPKSAMLDENSGLTAGISQKHASSSIKAFVDHAATGWKLRMKEPSYSCSDGSESDGSKIVILSHVGLLALCNTFRHNPSSRGKSEDQVSNARSQLPQKLVPLKGGC